MYFLIALFIFTTLIIGANFCFLLIGGTPFSKGQEGENIKMAKRTYTVERFAVGVSTGAFGLSWLIAWLYFLISGWDSFMANYGILISHVALQLFAAIGLMVAGIGIFRQWKRIKGIFLTSMGILVVSVSIAVIGYGPIGHGEPMFMYMLGIWTLVIGGFFTTAVHLLDRLMHGKYAQ